MKMSVESEGKQEELREFAEFSPTLNTLRGKTPVRIELERRAA
jgi:hypothetical protein